VPTRLTRIRHGWRAHLRQRSLHLRLAPAQGHKYDFHLCPSGLLTPGKVNVIGPECVMDPVSFMEREISQLQATGVAYKERLYVGNVHLVCPHHKLLDLIGSWNAPNLSTLMGMGPVHASKASRRGLRLDHLFNGREGTGGARERLERDLQVPLRSGTAHDPS
jgi:adenylosuccinate synthase